MPFPVDVLRRPNVRGGSTARTLVPSLRGVNAQVGWCSNYEFEDVVASVDDVELLTLQPAGHFALRQRVARTVAWRAPHPAFMRINPGIQPVTLDRDYDLFFFTCMNPWDLLYLNAIRGWQDRCRVKVCFMVEFYSAWTDEFGHFLRLLESFDHLALSFAGSVDSVGRVASVPTRHVPLAADVRRFTPWPASAPRVIDVLSVGRRSEPVHEALLGLARSQGIYYVHDTLPGSRMHPTSPSEHRDMYARSAKRSRLFVTYPAKFGDDESRGQSEVGARYFEGAAAGAVLLGQAPSSPAFRDHFPWPDAVLEARADGSGIAESVTDYLARPDALDRMGARNARDALLRHDWAHRWQSILQTAGMPALPALPERLRALERLAEPAEPGEETA